MTVRATVVEGAAVSPELLASSLREAGVVFGIRAETCAQLAAGLAEPDFRAEHVLIAEGRWPQQGEHGAFLAAFPYGIQPGHVREDGTMDFLDRELLKPVLSGDILGELRLARAGLPGRRVDGSELPASAVEEAELELGEGVLRMPDGRLRATRAGAVQHVANKKLDVLQSHEHVADVDLRSGHLDMQGSLIIRKSVQRSFRVTATGDVEILGGVDGGSVCAGGSIRIRGGVTGSETGQVSAAADLSARHAERARLACGGLLKLESSVNSELDAARIQIAGKLRGGHARAERELVASEVGAPSGTATLLSVGVPLAPPLSEARRALDMAKQQRSLRQRPFGAARSAPERGKSGKYERQSSVLARDVLEHKLGLSLRREALLLEAHVDVQGAVHAGVTVQLGAALLVVERALSNARFRLDPQTREVRLERLVQ